jgi:hypothetical protein
MLCRRQFSIAALVAACALSCCVGAAAASFEEQYQAWKERYKQALLASSQGRVREASDWAAKAEVQWQAIIMYYYEEPPAAFRNDDMWLGDLAYITGLQQVARWQLAAGRVQQAHYTLEPIRLVWADIHERNGQARLEDALVRYHETMEPVVEWATGQREGGVTAANGAAFGKEAGALAAEWAQVAAAAKKGAVRAESQSRLDELTARETEAIAALQQAAEKQQWSALPKAGAAVKAAFADIYMEFG